MTFPFDPDWAHKWRWRIYRRLLRAYLVLACAWMRLRRKR